MTKATAKAKASEGGLFEEAALAKPTRSESRKCPPAPKGGSRKAAEAAFEKEVAAGGGKVVKRKNEVVKHEPKPPAMPADPFVAMLREVSALPNINPEVVDRLLAAQERVMDRNARMAFDAAIIALQPELPVFDKDGRITVDKIGGTKLEQAIIKGRYAKYETVKPILTPLLHKHGLSLTHRITTAPDGRMRVTAVVKGHGHTDDSCYFDLAADPTGNKNPAQASASAVSYGKRHTAFAALGLVAKEEDDDGEGSGKPKIVGDPMTPEQLEQLMKLGIAVGCPGEHLLKHLNKNKPKGHPVAKEIADVPAQRFEEIIEALRSYEANKKAREEKASSQTEGKRE